ncbi:Uncharacterised protein [Mycobacteroides abscessus]|nr:Uncharacterised protein [Mycobacteroides abscessus]
MRWWSRRVVSWSSNEEAGEAAASARGVRWWSPTAGRPVRCVVMRPP